MDVREKDELQYVSGPYCVQGHDELEDAGRRGLLGEGMEIRWTTYWAKANMLR